jgi:acetate kinase
MSLQAVCGTAVRLGKQPGNAMKVEFLEGPGQVMSHQPASLLILNGGSSSLRFAVLSADETLSPLRRGKVERIGHGDAHLSVRGAEAGPARVAIAARDHGSAILALLDWIGSEELPPLAGAGHRVVHGLRRFEPARVTPDVLDELNRLKPLDPDHLPAELAMIEAVRRHSPELPQVACFDTLFHRDLPRAAAQLPIPRRFEAQGLRRYGFHGLSYAWLAEALERAAGREAAHGRVILAHLGGGASMAAMLDGRCIDTTMGFTPTAGLVMGTRPGDLDPGIAPWLARSAGIDSERYAAMINRESGLLGVSGTSADVRELLRAEPTDPHAAEAVALFCRQARKAIGSLAAVLGGLDTLVFSGGIGENAPVIRQRICEGLAFLGLELDDARNTAGADVISSGRVTVRVIATDEEHMIGRATRDLLALGKETP